MKSVLLSIVAASALWLGGTFTQQADAQVRVYRGGGYYGAPQAYNRGYNRGYYGGYRSSRPYYSNYRGYNRAYYGRGYYGSPYYGGGYYSPGIGIGVGGVGVGVGF